MNLSKSDEKRIFDKIYYPGNDQDCWPWTGYCNKCGYGKVNLNKVSVPVHRVIWEYYYGLIPSGLIVRHKCDNPPCCNPEHLEIGTQADNIQDMIDRKRDRKAKGSEAGSSKLDEQDIENIINGIIIGTFVDISDIMTYYNMSRNSIVGILNGEHWKVVTNKFNSNQLSQVRSLIMRSKFYFDEQDIRDIRRRIMNSESNVSIGKLYNVDPRLISNIRHNKSYSLVK